MLVAVLCGATAVGKSALALKLAQANGFEIISADSRQIYRGLDIGTGAPTPSDRASVPHHLIGNIEPTYAFSPREYPVHVHRILAERPQTGFLVVGGTGLYLKELLYPSPFDRGPTPEPIKLEVQERIRREGLPRMHAELLRLDPEGSVSVHANDAYRIAKRWENLLLTGESYARFTGPPVPDPRLSAAPVLWLDAERDPLYARIDARVEAMIRAGWPAEVERLRSDPAWRSWPAYSSLGYPEMTAVAEGSLALETAVTAIRKQTRNYAKRQRTFFRHQLPAAERWEAESLLEAMEAFGYAWDGFRESARIPGNRQGTRF
ncbi:MAG: tRNA (adenosine(37)-N6)-dimethylallyltransferase MiaA [Fibrobacteria bacterium]